MKNKNFIKKLLKKIGCIIFVIFLLLNSINQSLAEQLKSESSDDLCYGFIVSPLIHGNFTVMDNINCKIRHMINDILREQIQVFWTEKDISINVKEMNSSIIYQNRLFERGSFIVPFTGNLTIDNKIIAIVYDYNQTSEIEINNNLTVPIYILLKQVMVHVFPLNEVKIAQLYSCVTCGGFFFLKLMHTCGFLNIDTVRDKEISEKLKVSDFNVMFHPGAIFDYLFFVPYIIYNDIFYRTSDGVRSFVSNGGGYVGCCAGLLMTRAGEKIGNLPFNIYFKRRVNNPNLRIIGLYAIADILVRSPPELNSLVQINVINSTSPLTFGLESIVWDSWYGGREVCYTGKSVEVIANYYNTSTRIDDTPAWLTSNFGFGKIAIFSTHPEIAGTIKKPIYESHPFTGKTVVSNSLFYTTASDRIEYKTNISISLNYIYNFWEKTANLTNNSSSMVSIFALIRDRFKDIKNSVQFSTKNISDVIILIEDIAKENNIDIRKDKYYLGLEYLMDVKKFYYKLLTEFLDDSNRVFNKIELIHNLLKNDTVYVKNLKLLLNDILEILNKTTNLMDKIVDMVECFKQDLFNYNKKIIQFGINNFLMKMKSNNIYLNGFSALSKGSKIYFQSLKFLRHQWLNYESKLQD